MKGDKLLIEPHHTARAAELYEVLRDRLGDKFTVSIAGESGSGKSELARELVWALSERGHPAGVLQQDDYFVFPPRTNHKMRKRNLEQVGPYEVKLDLLDCNLRGFKRGENPLYKPLVIYGEDRITREELDTSGWQVLIAEGTYTSLLEFVDFRVFIDRDYRRTLAARRRRARDRWEPFIQEVLEREHRTISAHKALADAVIPGDFDRVEARR